MTKEEFIGNYSDWDSHRPLLWQALEATDGQVVEMGMGHGSTPFLHRYCVDKSRDLYSYDNNLEWVKEFRQYEVVGHELSYVQDWDMVSQRHKSPGVVLIDHSPGSRRKFDLGLFSTRAKIVIIHDSEPKGWNASDYRVRPLFGKFLYVNDMESKSPTGAWTTALSNQVDVTQWVI